MAISSDGVVVADDDLREEYGSIISSLPVKEGWVRPLRLYRNFWIKENLLPGAMAVRDRFTPRPDDIFVVTQPKSGTTWIKALAFTVANRSRHAGFSDHPLLTRHSQELVPFLEIKVRRDSLLGDIAALPSPRLLSTHMPLSMLPPGIADLGCRIIYLCREPKDVFVSRLHFERRLMNGELDTGDAFELFVGGFSPYGPLWDHCVEYWNESLARPERVLFLRYEEMKRDTAAAVRRLAEFIGMPFTEEEEKEAVVEQVVDFCSFEKMKGFEVNRSEAVTKESSGVEHRNTDFFRSGKVGDWSSAMTEEMARRLDGVVQEKLRGSGLSFAGAVL